MNTKNESEKTLTLEELKQQYTALENEREEIDKKLASLSDQMFNQEIKTTDFVYNTCIDSYNRITCIVKDALHDELYRIERELLENNISVEYASELMNKIYDYSYLVELEYSAKIYTSTDGGLAYEFSCS